MLNDLNKHMSEMDEIVRSLNKDLDFVEWLIAHNSNTPVYE